MRFFVFARFGFQSSRIRPLTSFPLALLFIHTPPLVVVLHCWSDFCLAPARPFSPPLTTRLFPFPICASHFPFFFSAHKERLFAKCSHKPPFRSPRISFVFFVSICGTSVSFCFSPFCSSFPRPRLCLLLCQQGSVDCLCAGHNRVCINHPLFFFPLFSPLISSIDVGSPS